MFHFEFDKQVSATGNLQHFNTSPLWSLINTTIFKLIRFGFPEVQKHSSQYLKPYFTPYPRRLRTSYFTVPETCRGTGGWA